MSSTAPTTTRGMSVESGGELGGIEHIEQSIRDILTTPLGSRVYRRDYGSRLPDMVDQPINAHTLAKKRAAIADALTRWEPRIALKKVLVSAAGMSQLSLDIEMELLTNGQPIKLSGVVI